MSRIRLLKSVFAGQQTVYVGEVISTSPLKIALQGTTVQQGVKKSEECGELEVGDEIVVVRNAEQFVITARVK